MKLSYNKVPKLFGNWETQTQELQKLYPELTDDDLQFIEGKENELISRMQSRLNKDRDDVIFIIKKSQSEDIR
jgi:uncharacterized protein YjbJ (UPF0337 family)